MEGKGLWGGQNWTERAQESRASGLVEFVVESKLPVLYSVLS